MIASIIFIDYTSFTYPHKLIIVENFGISLVVFI